MNGRLSQRRARTDLLTRRVNPERIYCPSCQRMFTSYYTPAPCARCDPAEYDRLYPLRRQYRSDDTRTNHGSNDNEK